jgi:hypothetical protein
MNALNRSTRRRLQELRQTPSVWEGDRRVLSSDFATRGDTGERTQGECVLWVDGTEGFVRAMDVVPPDAGHEAVVRTLLQAMEHPHSPASPSRPQKIVVRDREIQFFLRGVLQDLDIVVDYVPDLPLIDEIFQGLQGIARTHPPQLPPELVEPILKVAEDIWDDAPWELLDEEKVIGVEVNYGDVGTLYVSILGMLGMEFGLLMYRSLESLKTFRRRVLEAGESPEELEGAFLDQDCLYITFDQNDADSPIADPEAESLLAAFAERNGVYPTFGNLHPLEGMRPVLYDEEAETVLLALTALDRFFNAHLERLTVEAFPKITSRYRVAHPKEPGQKLTIKVSSLPDIAEELAEMSEEAGLADDGMPGLSLPVLRNDLIPDDAFYSLGAMPWDIFNVLRSTVKLHQKAKSDFPQTADGFPVILIQTSRPKATRLIEEIQAAGGLKAICFNPGEDPFSNDRYDLGVLQTANDELHLFGEFVEDDPVHVQARKKWDQRCKKTKGHCGLIVAKGFKGASRGNPGLGDMLALFEVQSISALELGLGSLQLMPFLD